MGHKPSQVVKLVSCQLGRHTSAIRIKNVPPINKYTKKTQFGGTGGRIVISFLVAKVDSASPFYIFPPRCNNVDLDFSRDISSNFP